MSLEKLLELTKPEMEQVNARILDAAKNHVELIPTITAHLVAAGGKRMRPMLTIASAKMCGLTGSRHVNLAAAVEFMHTATLLHDDVVDESNKRRGRDTANFIWGNKASVLVGDYLLGKAFQMMTSDGSIKVLQILSDAAARIAEGEVLQLSLTKNINTKFDEYLEVINAKTAELFAAACQVGGEVSGRYQEELRSFGENFGVAFQIIDDALDYSANREKFGKTIGDDLREGKVTLPVIYAYESANAADKKFWQDIIEKPEEHDDKVLKEACTKILKAGAFDETIKTAKRYASKAKNSLAEVAEEVYKPALVKLVDESIYREF